MRSSQYQKVSDPDLFQDEYDETVATNPLDEPGRTELPSSSSCHQVSSSSSSSSFLFHPVILCILVTETAERFAFFGFRAILVLYFTNALYYSENQAVAFFAYTTSLAYLSPLAGALLADGVLGRYKTIVWFSAAYVCGLIVLTAAAWKSTTDDDLAWKRALTAIGLFWVCIGTGGIKPCVSSFGADQVAVVTPSSKPLSRHEMDDNDDRTSEMVRGFFNYFYFCINVGAVTSIAIIPIVKQYSGFGPAFFVSTCFMVTALLLFLSKRDKYVHHKPGEDGSSLSYTFRLTWWLVRRQIWNDGPYCIRRHCRFLQPSPSPPQLPRTLLPTTPNDKESHRCSGSGVLLDQQLDDAAQALHVLPVIAMFPIYWCLYDQQGSVWTLQASRMELYGLQPEQLNVINPIEIMVFIPLFDRFIYPAMESANINVAPVRRMGWGMVLCALSFFLSGLVDSRIQYNAQHSLPPVSVWWQLPQITILAISEIFVSVTGLEFAYATAPPRLKAFLMALFCLTTAVGDLLSGVLYGSVFQFVSSRAVMMHICAILMMVNWYFFVFFIAKRYNARPAVVRHDSLGLETTAIVTKRTDSAESSSVLA